MITLSTFEVKTRLSELLSSVEQGEQVVITRHGQPVAKLVAVEAADGLDASALAARKTLVQQVAAASRRRSLKGIDPKSAAEEGRD